MKISRFEDIEAWKSARKLMNMVYEVTSAQAFDVDLDLIYHSRESSSAAQVRAALQQYGSTADSVRSGSEDQGPRTKDSAARRAAL